MNVSVSWDWAYWFFFLCSCSHGSISSACGTVIRLNNSKAEHALLEEQNHQLRLVQAALADPQRIDTLARTQLGMIAPSPQQVIRVGAPGPAAEAMESPELARNFSVGSGDTLHEP